jgi:hypothetical protein
LGALEMQVLKCQISQIKKLIYPFLPEHLMGHLVLSNWELIHLEH